MTRSVGRGGRRRTNRIRPRYVAPEPPVRWIPSSARKVEEKTERSRRRGRGRLKVVGSTYYGACYQCTCPATPSPVQSDTLPRSFTVPYRRHSWASSQNLWNYEDKGTVLGSRSECQQKYPCIRGILWRARPALLFLDDHPFHLECFHKHAFSTPFHILSLNPAPGHQVVSGLPLAAVAPAALACLGPMDLLAKVGSDCTMP